jgi:hypothetical protein
MFAAPVTVRSPGPITPPLLWEKPFVVEAPFRVSVPPCTVVVAVLAKPFATVSKPPEMTKFSSLVSEFTVALATGATPLKVIVWTPATLMVTSSAAPGKPGFQFAAIFQFPLPPIQTTGALNAEEARQAAAKDPRVKRLRARPTNRRSSVLGPGRMSFGT